MSHFFDATGAANGWAGLATATLPQWSALLKQHAATAEPGQATATIDVDQLYAAIHQVFDGPGDQVFFELASDSRQTGLGERRLRIDPGSANLRPPYVSLKRLISALGLAKAKEMLHAADWVVLVADESTLDLEQAAQLLQQYEQVRRFLLIWCGANTHGESSAPPNSQGPATARLPGESHAGVLAGAEQPFDEVGLVTVLKRLKAQTTAAVLDLRLRQAFLGSVGDVPPLEIARGAETTALRPGGAQSIAVDALVRLAADDPRIVAIALDADRELARFAERFPERYFEIPAADADALAWCAGLAAGGCRPLLCTTESAFVRSWPAVVAEICAPQQAVKLLVLASRAEAGRAAQPGLALLKLLPETPLLVPRDAIEMEPMLDFLAAYAGPAALWSNLEREAHGADLEPARARVQLGKAELLGNATDVALIAWGETCAAAQRAAQLLAGVGVGATVVNARFLQPLDRTAIAQALAAAQICVVLDDARWHSGFAPAVLELVADLGATAPVTVAWAPQGTDLLDVRAGRDHFALQIFERCQWLSAPIVPGVAPALVGGAKAEESCKSAAVKWLKVFGADSTELTREREQVFAQQLNADIHRWVAAYQEVGSRDVYLWKWCLHGVELTTLPCVDPALRAHVCDTKVLSIVLCVLLDDVADQHGDGRFLETLLDVTCWGASRELPPLTPAELRHVEITRALWQEYQSRVASYPGFAEFEPVLRYDLLQFFNTMRYSHLVNSRPYLLNMAEHDLYTSHNMMMVSFSTLDLMCSRRFPQDEVGALREAMWHAQCMGRIGNLLSTWRRELGDRDLTSGVFVHALMDGDVTLAELQTGRPEQLVQTIRACGHEDYFFDCWQRHRDRCHARARAIRSLDLRAVLAGHDRFFAMHLGSQGLI